MKKNNKTPKSEVVTSTSVLKQRSGSIKFKLLGIIIPVISVIVLTLIIISYQESHAIITADADELLNLSTKNQVKQIEAWLNENLASFQAVKTSIESSNPDSTSLQNILNAFSGYSSNYADGLYIADENGNVIAATKSTVHTGEDVKNAVWYKEGLTRINMAFGTPYPNKEGKIVISASGMLTDSSGKIKVISADVLLDRISIIVNSLVEMDNAEAILVNRSDNVILAARDANMISTTLDTQSKPLYQSMLKKIANGDFSAEELNHNMVNMQKISGTNWLLVSYVPTNSILSQLYKLRTIMIVISIISILVLLVLTERVMQIVLKPVKMLTKTIVTMGNGDFSVDVVVNGNDEISVMSKSLKDFIVVMRGMINDMNTISNQLFQQSEGSSEIAGQLFDSSALQSDSMKNLNTTVDELAHSVNEIAENATSLAHFVSEASAEGQKVNTKMQDTVDVSKKGKTDMEQVLFAMTTIQNSIRNLEEMINKVGNSSREITNIVNLIGNIAEETSLLSLNASIEAARAGEAGKGFAVVASEIGKLSNTSAQAVQNIDNLIKQIIELVSNTVAQSKESSAYIEESSIKITTAVCTFNDIFDAIQMTSSLVEDMLQKIEQVDNVANNVAAISEEQAASSEEILATSEEMVHQANVIAENSKNVAHDSQKLEETAGKLGEQVQQFKL